MWEAWGAGRRAAETRQIKALDRTWALVSLGQSGLRAALAAWETGGAQGYTRQDMAGQCRGVVGGRK